MKRFLQALVIGFWSVSMLHAATLTVSNYNGSAIHGIADSEGTLIGSGDGFGIIGRMKISDAEIANLIAAKDYAALLEEFEVFASSAGPFTLNSGGAAGAFEAELSASTIPSANNEFGGSHIYVWLYKGSDILAASDFLIAKLAATFPTDPAEGPPAGPVEVNLRADATFLAGGVSTETHDYGLGGGAVAILEMAIQEQNQAPVVENFSLSVAAGAESSGQLIGSDADDDELIFSKLSEPTKGAATVNADGTFTYTANADASGVDSFTFKAKDGTLDSNTGTVNVTITAPPAPEAPVIAVIEPEVGYVGTYYEYQIKIANTPQGNATSYIASGLPSGLKLDTKTGWIKGIPSKAYELGQTAQISAKNAAGTGAKQPITFIIKPVPTEVIGTFVARVDEATSNEVGSLAGRVDLTTTSKGSFTAKLLAGTVTYSGKGYLAIDEEDDELVVSVSVEFVRKGYPTFVADLLLDMTEGPEYAAHQLTGSLKEVGDEVGADVTGVRNTWTKDDKPEDYVGGYTYGLSIPENLQGEEHVDTVPQGTGFGALTVSDKGTVSFTGKTADGKVFTVASVLGRAGDMPFYCALPSGAGSLVALPKITLGAINGLGDSMRWRKPEADSKSKERAYRAGFDSIIELTLFGGLYQGASLGGVVAGLDDNGPTDTTTPNAWLSFLSGGLETGDVDPFGFVIMNKKETGVTQTVIVPKSNTRVDPNPNPNAITFKLLSKPAGYFSGTVTIPNEVKSLVRKVTYQGTFIRNPNGSFNRLGYFLMPKLPVPETGEKLTTTPLLSGQVELDSEEPASD